MIFVYVILLTVNVMTSLCSSQGPICDENCADKPVFTPSTLVVEYGDETSVSCTACQHGCQQGPTGMEISAGETTQHGNVILWKVENVTEWDLSAVCYYTKASGRRCCSRLPITVYKPPTRVSLHFEKERFYSGYEYKLQCKVEDIAPIGNVLLIFYSAHLPIFRHQFSNYSATPVNESYTVTGRTLDEVDGSQHWCEANLNLGPDTKLKYASKIRKDDVVPHYTTRDLMDMEMSASHS